MEMYFLRLKIFDYKKNIMDLTNINCYAKIFLLKNVDEESKKIFNITVSFEW